MLAYARGERRRVRRALRAPQGRRLPLPAAPLRQRRHRRRAVPGRVDERDSRPRDVCADREVHDVALHARAQPAGRSLARERPGRRCVSIDDDDGRATRDAVEALPGARADEPDVRAQYARARRTHRGGARRRCRPRSAKRSCCSRKAGCRSRRSPTLTGVGDGNGEEPPALRDREAAPASWARSARGVDMTDRDPRDPGARRGVARAFARSAACAARSRRSSPPRIGRPAAVRSRRDRAPHATRPWRWWMPLAAAATIGAIAVGVLQVAPDDALTTDDDAATSRAALGHDPRRNPRRRVRSTDRCGRSRSRVPCSREPDAQRAGVSASLRLPPAPASRGAEAQAPRRRRVNSAPRAARAVETPRTPRRRPIPFPRRKAAAGIAESADASRAPAAAARAPAAVARRRWPRALRRPARRESRQSADLERDSRVGGPARCGREPAAARKRSGRPRLRSNSASSRCPTMREAPRDPAAWIARIRAQLAEGNKDEAARELAAFRAAYRDADARLPADLRAWALTIKP